MEDTRIKTETSLIFTNNAKSKWNFPYSCLYHLATSDFTFAELNKLAFDLTTKQFVNDSCFSEIEFSSTIETKSLTGDKKPSLCAQIFIFITRKEQKKFKCGVYSISDCAYNIQHGKCPRKQVHRKFYELFHQNEHN